MWFSPLSKKILYELSLEYTYAHTLNQVLSTSFPPCDAKSRAKYYQAFLSLDISQFFFVGES